MARNKTTLYLFVDKTLQDEISEIISNIYTIFIPKGFAESTNFKFNFMFFIVILKLI